jgi:hypothetical protein
MIVPPVVTLVIKTMIMAICRWFGIRGTILVMLLRSSVMVTVMSVMMSAVMFFFVPRGRPSSRRRHIWVGCRGEAVFVNWHTAWWRT